MDDEGIGLGALEDPVGLSGYGIGGDGVGVGELVRGVEVVVVLPRVSAGLREAVVYEDSAPARHKR